MERAIRWDGEPFAGATLLVTRDQGYGDAIAFARYLPAVKARGGRVILETAPALAPLFAQLTAIDELRVVDEATIHADPIDLHIPIWGLPGALRTELDTIPAAVPYLHPAPERRARWRRVLAGTARRRIGIVWAGNPDHRNDHHRSCRLDDFAPLGGIDGVAWFGLQHGAQGARRGCGTLEIEPLGPRIADFADTAAIVRELDLVITVDTAVAHLAGALGTPVWTLLPYAPDWRWLRERHDSPWYPTMRLFRQPRPGDWAAVIAAVGQALQSLLVTAPLAV